MLTYFVGKDGEGQPTFTQMSQWRGVLHRLTCFIRLIDFLMMELLRRLVLAALRTLLAQVKASSVQGIKFDCYNKLPPVFISKLHERA